MRAAWLDVCRTPIVYLGGVSALLALLVLARYTWWAAVFGPFVLAVATLVATRFAVWLLVPAGWRSRVRSRAPSTLGTMVAGSVVLWLGTVAGWLMMVAVLMALVGVLGMTQEERYRARVRAMLACRVASVLGIEPEAVRVRSTRWDGRRLVAAEIIRGTNPGVHDERRQDRAPSLIAETLRDTGVSYEVSWSRDRAVLFVRSPHCPPRPVIDSDRASSDGPDRSGR